MHNEELHGLYSSPNIIRVLKSKNIKLVRGWGGGVLVLRMGER